MCAVLSQKRVGDMLNILIFATDIRTPVAAKQLSARQENQSLNRRTVLHRLDDVR